MRFPKLLITGTDGARMSRVGQALEGLKVRIDVLRWEEALESLAEEVTAIVLVLPMRKIAMATAVEILRDHPDVKAAPLYCVVPDDTSSRQVRRLYKAGANAVLDWPRERSVFRDLFAESYGITRVRGRAPEADKALAHSVRAHLRIFPELDPGRLRLFARDGLISVSGQTRSLIQRRQIVDAISSVPGVRAVISQGLQVAASEVPDKSLKRRLRSLLRDASDLDESTILVEVRNGHVEITGTVGERSDIQRLEDLVIQPEGVRAMDVQVGVSPRRQRADSQQSRRYRKAIKTLYPNESVSLSFVNGCAILTGKVRTLSTKRSIARLVERDSATRAVINKITVE